MDDLKEYEELATYSNIRYTPAWYYKQFPGFYNIECYKILAAHTKKIPLCPVVEEESMTTDVPDKNKKRSYEEVESS